MELLYHRINIDTIQMKPNRQTMRNKFRRNIMKRVPVKDGSEKVSYYKYYLEDIVGISDELREKLMNSKGKKEDALEIYDREKLQSNECYPSETGYYPLKKGGALVASNVKIPNITNEMIEWWTSWFALDPLRYALWDPEDHYDISIDEYGRKRALDPSVPMGEKLWGATHYVEESFDGEEPTKLVMKFISPADAGYDMSLLGTDQCVFMVCAESKMGKMPVFVTETFSKINGNMEVRLRFWIGYELKDGKAKCKLPPFIKIPENMLKGLLIHNFKEFAQMNKILPSLYAEEKDNL